MSTTATELRELARQIDETARASPCYSIAWDSVRQLTSHLALLARVHEINAAVAAVQGAALFGPQRDDCRECGGGPCRRRPRHGDGPNL